MHSTRVPKTSVSHTLASPRSSSQQQGSKHIFQHVCVLFPLSFLRCRKYLICSTRFLSYYVILNFAKEHKTNTRHERAQHLRRVWRWEDSSRARLSPPTHSRGAAHINESFINRWCCCCCCTPRDRADWVCLCMIWRDFEISWKFSRPNQYSCEMLFAASYADGPNQFWLKYNTVKNDT